MEKRCCVGWISWVCNPYCEPYCGCILSDTEKAAEATFCDANGKRSRMFKDSKIIHQKITIRMPAEVVAEHNKWLKHIGGSPL